MASSKVYFLDNGCLHLDKSFITWNHGQGTEVRFPVYSVYIDHPDAKIIVDTGFDKAWVDKHLPFEKPIQSKDQTIEAQLAKCNVKPEDIDIVINTHLHFDHCTWNKLFTNAVFYVGREELRFAYVPEFQAIGYHRPFFDYEGAKWELATGDIEVVKGVNMLFCPGHTPGHYSVTVDLPSHLMVLTVDTAFTRENMEHKMPMGLHTNPFQQIESMERLERIARVNKGKLYFSHDMEEFKTYKKAPEYYA